MLRIDKFKLVYMFPFTDERLKSVYMFLTNRQTADMFPIPIYDSYVDKVLCFFRDRDGFAIFRTEDLKDYLRFKSTLIDFRKVYGLEEYNLKEIDKYIWQLGKEYFPKITEKAINSDILARSRQRQLFRAQIIKQS